MLWLAIYMANRPQFIVNGGMIQKLQATASRTQTGQMNAPILRAFVFTAEHIAWQPTHIITGAGATSLDFQGDREGFHSTPKPPSHPPQWGSWPGFPATPRTQTKAGWPQAAGVMVRFRRSVLFSWCLPSGYAFQMLFRVKFQALEKGSRHSSKAWNECGSVNSVIPAAVHLRHVTGLFFFIHAEKCGVNHRLLVQ